MSQITIVDEVLNFTELNSPMQHAAERAGSSNEHGSNEHSSDEHGSGDGEANQLDEEEQRTVHELTSILISGHLPL